MVNKQVERAIDDKIAPYTISEKGIHGFFTNFEDIKPGVILMTATAHYSLVKVTEALGIGKQQIKYIPIDKYFSMDIGVLEETLSNCLKEHKPIIALISFLGSTEEGAVDYIHKIIQLQNKFKKEGLTFYHHCDAAWGGYIRALFYKQDWSEEEREGKPFIGRYILEGSKPGAAAVACWLAHKIVPLN